MESMEFMEQDLGAVLHLFKTRLSVMSTDNIDLFVFVCIIVTFLHKFYLFIFLKLLSESHLPLVVFM